MRKILVLLATASVAAFAQLPNTFRANDPAKADAVMANFRYLDSAVGSKADTAALRAVKASIPVGVNIGGKVDTAALTQRLSNYATVGAVGSKADTAALNAVKASIPVGVNIGGKVDTAALTVRLSGYAPASALANYATTSSLSNLATTAALTSGLGAKADTAALSAVKASIPAGVNIGGKVDTAALTVRLAGYVPSATLTNYATTASLAGYAKSTDLAGFAKSTDLSGYATTTALANYAPLTSLASYAKTTDLASYAKATDLSAYAKTTALASYATTASLADYAKATDLSSKADLTTVSGIDYRVGSLEAYYKPGSMKTSVGTPAGTMEYQFNLNMNSGMILSQYMVSSGSKKDIVNLRTSTVTFYEDVKVDGALTVGTSIKVAGVTMAVPDYVFEPEYKLAPLAEVEAYTQANKHLPDVPSAAEIKKGGLDLTEMNLTLLRKVEELTLHAIAQEKQIKAQNDRIQSLESRLTN